jgi:hypothetical protein
VCHQCDFGTLIQSPVLLGFSRKKNARAAMARRACKSEINCEPKAPTKIENIIEYIPDEYMFKY